MQELQRRKAQRSFLKNFDPLLPADPAHRPDAILSRSLSSDWTMLTRMGSDDEQSFQTPAEKESARRMAEAMVHFREVLAQPTIDIDKLKYLSHSGVPGKIRPAIWPLLLGYWPTRYGARKETVHKKREEYRRLLAQHLKNEKDMNPEQRKLWHQVKIDVPRTTPKGFMLVFHHKRIQRALSNILYLWSILRPEIDYFQGLNDLCVPFILILLSRYVGGDIDAINVYQLDTLSNENMLAVEADTFWCMSHFLAHIQDNFVISNTGIEAMINKMEELVRIHDEPLYRHLKSVGIDFLIFAMRWVITLLVREMPIKSLIRLWDSYLCKTAQMVTLFHLCVCAAFLTTWSDRLRKFDFSEAVIFLQHLERETKYWSDLDIDKLIARANVVMAEEQIYTHLCVVCSSIIIVLTLVLVVVVFVVLLCLLALTLSARAAAAAIQRSSQELHHIMASASLSSASSSSSSSSPLSFSSSLSPLAFMSASLPFASAFPPVASPLLPPPPRMGSSLLLDDFDLELD